MNGETAQCPVCGRPARVNLDGKLRKHKARLQTSKAFGAWCPNQSPNATVKVDGAASGGRLNPPVGPGTVPNPDGSKLPSRSIRARRVDSIRERVLSNPAARAAYKDAEARNLLIDALIGLRRGKGITQAQVAARMNVSQPTVCGLETEGSDPQLSTLQRYARAVGADLILEVRSQRPV